MSVAVKPGSTWEKLKVDYDAWILRENCSGQAWATMERQAGSLMWTYRCYAWGVSCSGATVAADLVDMFDEVEATLVSAGASIKPVHRPA